jgi:tRNA pseudouridine38-40 synthase
MENVLLLVEYDGAHYSGWQRQENSLAIQQVLEDALFTLTGVRTEVIGAGRTDAGVHAIGMVANFRIDCPIPAERFAKRDMKIEREVPFGPVILQDQLRKLWPFERFGEFSGRGIGGVTRPGDVVFLHQFQIDF